MARCLNCNKRILFDGDNRYCKMCYKIKTGYEKASEEYEQELEKIKEKLKQSEQEKLKQYRRVKDSEKLNVENSHIIVKHYEELTLENKIWCYENTVVEKHERFGDDTWKYEYTLHEVKVQDIPEMFKRGIIEILQEEK